MRALFSSVLAGLLLLSATGAGAQSLALATGVGSDAVVSGVVGADAGGARPTVAMDAQVPTNQTFTITFLFSEPVTGFDVDDLTVTHGRAGLEVRGSGRNYMVDSQARQQFRRERDRDGARQRGGERRR